MNDRELKILAQQYEQQIRIDLAIGKIHKNADGKYKKSIQMNDDIHTGKRQRIQAEGDTIEECAENLAKKYSSFMKKNHEKLRFRSFEEVAKEWYDVEIKNAPMSIGNKKNYEATLRLSIFPKLGKFDISQMKKKDLQVFLNSFAGCGESKVKKIRLTLLRVINYAMENEYMPEHIIKLKLPTTTPIRERKILSEDQLKLLINAQKKYKPAYVFITMVATGLRPSELYKITYSDIDFEKKLIYVRHSKTSNGIRTLPVPQYVIDVIKEDMKLLSEKGLSTQYAFHEQNNPQKPLNSSTFYQTWKTTLREMDILAGATVYRNKITKSALESKDDLEAYCLRHTYCTLLNNCQIGEYFKKRLMGHTLKSSITDSVYTHSSEADIIKAAEPIIKALDDLFENA